MDVWISLNTKNLDLVQRYASLSFVLERISLRFRTHAMRPVITIRQAFFLLVVAGNGFLSWCIYINYPVAPYQTINRITKMIDTSDPALTATNTIGEGPSDIVVESWEGSLRVHLESSNHPASVLYAADELKRIIGIEVRDGPIGPADHPNKIEMSSICSELAGIGSLRVVEIASDELTDANVSVLRDLLKLSKLALKE